MRLLSTDYRIISLLILLLVSPLYSHGQDVRYMPEPQGTLIKNAYYCVDYNTAHKQANWVYYMLTETHISGDTPRSSSFKDCQEGNIRSASTKDYTHSGYDRGHLCPAADMKLSKEAMNATFQMWNISPQNPSLNRGKWAELEETVRDYIKDATDTLYIVTGPVFLGEREYIGDNRVTIPGLFYKVVYNPKRGGIGFLMPNRKLETPLKSWQVSIDLVEAITGIDFFPQLPDKSESEIESQVTWWE